MVYIYIYPLAIHNPNDFKPELISKHTDKEWRKMLRELRKTCKEYQETYGVYVRKVERFMDNFIGVNADIVDQDKFSKWGNDLEEVFCDFLNHDLYHGGYPSFYKDNWEGEKYIDSFTCLFSP